MVEKVSTNSIYAGKHWTFRDRVKASYSLEVKRATKEPIYITGFPVELHFVFQFKGKLLDSSNCSFIAKMIEDSLIVNGIIPDDSPKYVSSVKYTSVKGKEDKIILDIV